MAETLGVSRSALQRWISQSNKFQLETISFNPLIATMASKEKSPQDWTLEEKLKLVIESDGLNEQAISELCRTQGVFPHHINQWKQHFITGTALSTETKKQTSIK